MAARGGEAWIREIVSHVMPIWAAAGLAAGVGGMDRRTAPRRRGDLGSDNDRLVEAVRIARRSRSMGRILYGLSAILRLHFAQEDEAYLALMDDHPAA